jgi:1,4-alpha-glucan branching enzyme
MFSRSAHATTLFQPASRRKGGSLVRAVALLWLLLLGGFQSASAQYQGDNDGCCPLYVRDGFVHLIVERAFDSSVRDSVLRDLGFRSLEQLDSLSKANATVKGPNEKGWEFIKRKGAGKLYIFRKNLAWSASAFPKAPQIFMPDWDWMGAEGQSPMYGTPFGANDFKETTVRPVGNWERRASEGRRSTVRFRFPDRSNANRVMLAGSFNEWSTTATPMQITDSGWIAELDLVPGRYAYKFIVDGRWQEDPYNRNRESDGHHGFNSVFFMPNHRFTLGGYQDAKKVFVAGNFNAWEEKDLAMKQHPSGWFLDVWFDEGTYSYKYIVDKEWITDPGNPVVREDGMGNRNSFIAFGDTTWFALDGFQNARSVVLSGDFNGWNEAELRMDKIAGGWSLGYSLKPGNYGYKFIVDGQWITDPANPIVYGMGEEQNSLHVEAPNHRFRLPANDTIQSVGLTGDFNGWDQVGYTMKRDKQGWYLDLYLPLGKHRYKYIVNGVWIRDPNNPQWEENEYGTGNSVIWKEALEALKTGTP